MNEELRTSDQEVSPTEIEWPQSKGDPIGPVWSYAKKKGMYQAEALRMMAHDIVERIKELELPLHKAMKAAHGDGLTTMAYIKTQTRQINGLTQENVRLRRQVAELGDEVRELRHQRDATHNELVHRTGP
jgi:hypothetical protein